MNYGRIISFSDGVSMHFSGTRALQDAIDYADEHGLKVCVVSDPASIKRDLEGSRERERAEYGARNVRSDPVFDSPERRQLRAVGRLDLLEQPEPAPRWHPVRIARRRVSRSGE